MMVKIERVFLMIFNKKVLSWILSIIVLIILIVLLIIWILDIFTSNILLNAEKLNSSELASTSRPILASMDTSSVIGGMGEGLSCSVPEQIEDLFFPNSNNFFLNLFRKRPKIDGSSINTLSLYLRQACVTHDYCYRHGAATYNYTRLDCDTKLQKDAFKICNALENQNPNEDIKGNCEMDTIKVKLGVRLGGESAFRVGNIEKDQAEKYSNRKLSSFFEYDPKPVSNERYVVARVVNVANLPCNLKKQLYYFEVGSSGTKVTQISWGGDENSCKPYHPAKPINLPGNPDFVEVPPLITRDTQENDWFVWWDRPTGSCRGEKEKINFVALNPGSLKLENWPSLFSNKYQKESEANVTQNSCNPENEIIKKDPGKFVKLKFKSELTTPFITQFSKEPDEIIFAGFDDNPKNTQLVTQTVNYMTGESKEPKASEQDNANNKYFTVAPLFSGNWSNNNPKVISYSRQRFEGLTKYKKQVGVLVIPLEKTLQNKYTTPYSFDAIFDEEYEPAVLLDNEPVARNKVLLPKLFLLRKRNSNKNDFTKNNDEGYLTASVLHIQNSGSLHKPEPLLNFRLDDKWIEIPPTVLLPGIDVRYSRILFSRIEVNSNKKDMKPTLGFRIGQVMEKDKPEWKIVGGSDCNFSSDNHNKISTTLPYEQIIVADMVGDKTPDIVVTNKLNPLSSLLLSGKENGTNITFVSDSKYLGAGLKVDCSPSRENDL